MRYLLTAVCCLCSSLVLAQHHVGSLPDFRVAYPADRVVIIPAGETVAMPSGDIDLLWIEGTCVAPRDADLSLKVREIVVMEGGHLDMGTAADPIRGKVTVTFADGGFSADDPAQWGHGLIVFGKFDCWGTEKTPWHESTDSDPVGWNVDDRLRQPDTRPCGPSFKFQYRSSDGTYAREPNDVVGVVTANMTRSITFRSENPAGTRGHTIYTDHGQVMIGYTAFEGLGRTKPEPLSPINLIGRYPIHFHHFIGPHTDTQTRALNATVKGVVVDGLDYRSKWGLVIHATSWVRVEDCVVTRVGGAGFVTESGEEVGNQFVGNLAWDCSAGVRQFPIDVHEGFQGSGFWCKSMVQVFENNLAMNNRHGFQSAINRRDSPTPRPDAIPEKHYQVFPGGPRDGIVTQYQTTLSGKGNRFVCNNETGYDAWGSSCDIRDQPSPVFVSLAALPIHWEDCDFAYNGNSQAQHTFTQCATAFTDCDFVGSNGSAVGCDSQIDYQRVLYFDGCTFDGTPVGLVSGRGMIVRQCMFSNPTSIVLNGLTSQQWPYGVTMEANVHTGIPFTIVGTPKSVDDIIPHIATMDDVYADIEQYRAVIGGSVVDPNEAERQRLTEQISSVMSQIGNLQSLLQDLQNQLNALGR